MVPQVQRPEIWVLATFIVTFPHKRPLTDALCRERLDKIIDTEPCRLRMSWSVLAVLGGNLASIAPHT